MQSRQFATRSGKTGEWPTPWTQSLVITLPRRGNLQQCQNYRTLSLISHPSKVMLKIILKSRRRSYWRGGEDHRWRTGRLRSRQEHHRADLQPTSPLWEISLAPARPLPRLHRLQEGLLSGLACSLKLVREQPATVVAVDWSWPNEWN